MGVQSLGSRQDDGSAVKLGSAVSVIVAFIAAMAGFVYLASKGIDTTAYIAFVGVTLLPQAMALFRGDKMQADVTQIKHRTNGPLDEQARILAEIQKDIRELKGGNNAGSS